MSCLKCGTRDAELHTVCIDDVENCRRCVAADNIPSETALHTGHISDASTTVHAASHASSCYAHRQMFFRKWHKREAFGCGASGHGTQHWSLMQTLCHTLYRQMLMDQVERPMQLLQNAQHLLAVKAIPQNTATETKRNMQLSTLYRIPSFAVNCYDKWHYI